MSNFQNKPICPDGANSDKIIDKMIKRASSHKTNPLKELVFKQLRSKQFSEINIDSISDFPIFKRKQLVREIFLATYQLKMSPSYASDILLNGYKVNEKFKCKNNLLHQKLTNGSQLLAANLASRHRRGEIKGKNQDKKLKVMYKVFILYDPKSTDAIQGILTFIF